MSRLRMLAGALCVPAALLGAVGADAVEFDVFLGYEGQVTDNVARAPTDEEDDVVHSPLLTLAARQEGAVVSLESNYRAQRRIFQEDTFRDDYVVNGTTQLRAELAPQRLFWDASHTRTQSLLDVRFVENPLNQAEIDTIGTGLEYRTSPSRRNQLSLSGRIEDQTSTIVGGDNLRGTARAEVSRDLNPVYRVGISVEAEDVDFEERLVPDFQRLDARLLLERNGPRLTVQGTVGQNWVDRVGADVQDGLSLELDAIYALSARQQLSARASRRFANQTRFAFGGIPDEGAILEQGAFAQVFELETFDVGYAFEGDRWAVSLGASTSDQQFSGVDRRQQQDQMRINVSRALSASVSLVLVATLQRLELDIPDATAREDDQLLSIARIEWEPGARTRMSAGLRYDESDSNVPQFQFTQRSVVLTLERQLF